LTDKPQRSFPQISDTEDYEDDGVEYGFRWREDGFRYLIHSIANITGEILKGTSQPNIRLKYQTT